MQLPTIIELQMITCLYKRIWKAIVIGLRQGVELRSLRVVRRGRAGQTSREGEMEVICHV